jgi:hypothetical protein
MSTADMKTDKVSDMKPDTKTDMTADQRRLQLGRP